MIVLENISKAFANEPVLREITFRVAEQHTLSVLGKSGCGKSTLLKIMAGLETADAGRFSVDDRDMLTQPAQKRGIVYLSQEPLLFPHLTVFHNLGYGLAIRKESQASIRQKVTELAGKLGLAEHLAKMPHQLSGGQKQRVSFGRGLIINPRIMLLDEPFGSLDADTRAEMQELYRHIRTTFRITSLFVTHDLKEALIMGDQVARMENGYLHQYATLKDFITATESGVAEEVSFWRKITDDQPSTPHGFTRKN